MSEARTLESKEQAKQLAKQQAKQQAKFATQWPYPQWIAHRGGGNLAPENTLAAMAMGLRFGYTAVEFDVKLSRDGVCVLLHDDTLERTSNGVGPAAEQDAEALYALDAGGWFGAEFAGEAIPSFDAVAAYCQQNGIAANVEIKPCPGRDEETGRVVAAAAARMWQRQGQEHGQGQGQGQPPLLSSFSWPALLAARAAAPGLPCGWLIDEWQPDWRAKLTELGAVALHCDHLLLNQARVAEVRQAGFRLLAYTVNEPERAAELLSWGVDGIITDALATLPPPSPN